MGTGYERPGRGAYVSVTGAAVPHGDCWTEGGRVGTVIKQQAYDADSARGPGRALCAIGERVFLRMKGIAEARTGVGEQGAAIAALAFGAPVFIADGTGADAKGTLHPADAAGRVGYGFVHEVPGIHGTPTGIIRIDLDQKPAG